MVAYNQPVMFHICLFPQEFPYFTQSTRWPFTVTYNHILRSDSSDPFKRILIYYNYEKLNAP